MLFVCNGAESRRLIPSKTAVYGFNLLFKFSNKFICNAVLNNTARKSHTSLTAAAECWIYNAGNGSFKSTVLKNESMIFSLAKSLASLTRSGSSLINFKSDRSRTDKSNALNIGVVENGINFISWAGYDIYNALWYARLNIKFCDTHSGSRCEGSGFKDNGITASNTNRYHPAKRNHSRKINRNNTRKNSHSLTIFYGIKSSGSVHKALAHHKRRCLSCKFGALYCLTDITGSLCPCLTVFLTNEHGKFIKMLI